MLQLVGTGEENKSVIMNKAKQPSIANLAVTFGSTLKLPHSKVSLALTRKIKFYMNNK